MTDHTRVCSRHFKLSQGIISHDLHAVKKIKTDSSAVYIFLEARLSGEEDVPEESPVKRKILAKGSETSTTNSANANISSTCEIVTAVAISEEIDKTSDPLEVDDKGTQDESMSELKKEMEELKTKLEEEKAKTNALLID